MQPATQAWWFAAGRMLATVMSGLLVGWLFGNVWVGLGVALAMHLGWQLANLFRLEWWLRHRSFADPPDVGGVFGEIIAQIVRLHRRKRFHKQRFVQLMRQLQRSTAALPNGVVILNAQREIIWFNRMAARLLDLRRTADLGLRIENLLRSPQFARYLEIGDFGSPIVIMTTTGEDSYLSLQMVPYGEGQQLLLVGDVSRQMRLEAMRKDFVANASHELRSPLTVISGYLETLSQDESVDPNLRGPIDAMRRQALRMTAIVHDLLELSRLEAEEGALTGEPVDVGALLGRLRSDLLARLSQTRDVQIVVDSSDRLLGVEAQLHSAFGNLLENAAKYTAPDGTIAMRWWRDEQGGHLSVRDTGIGIAAAHIPRLTERFYRVDPGRSRASGGSGLGLAIVKHVLQRHGARLQIESEEGKGSTFSCHFPPGRLVPAG